MAISSLRCNPCLLTGSYVSATAVPQNIQGFKIREEQAAVQAGFQEKGQSLAPKVVRPAAFDISTIPSFSLAA